MNGDCINIVGVKAGHCEWTKARIISFRAGQVAMQRYLLPSHPDLSCSDPLSIVDVENPTVWQVITAHISSTKSLARLPDLIEDLAYSLHGNGHLDTRFLRQFLGHAFGASDPVAERVLRNVVDDALSLPVMFPSHSIHHLSLHNPRMILSALQARSLVAHQLLGTLKPPQGNDWGPNFFCWYSFPQPLENAVTGYLTTLFHYFKERGSQSSFMRIEFCSGLAADTSHHAFQSCRKNAFGNLVLEPTGVSTVPFPHETIQCTVISSNASPGFGSACTQEELVTAACPELLPIGAILISTPVPSDAAILVRNATPASRWAGQGRFARLIQTQNGRPHDFLLIDAAELDASSRTFPDLTPAILQRDLHKLLVGFAALRRNSISRVTSPLWGSGSFGGDPIVKAIMIAMVAAFTDLQVWLSIDDSRVAASNQTVLEVLQDLRSTCRDMTVHEALLALGAADDLCCRDGLDVANLFSSRVDV